MDDTGDQGSARPEGLSPAGVVFSTQPETQEVEAARDHYPVTITKVANGFCLQIGCKIFIAKTWVEASAGLAEYWENPRKAEKKYSA